MRLIDHAPYVEASAAYEQARRAQTDAERAHAAAVAERDRLAASLDPADVDRLEAAERDLLRAERVLRLAQNATAAAERALGDAKAEAVRQVEAHYRARYDEQVEDIIEAGEALHAAIQELRLIEADCRAATGQRAPFEPPFGIPALAARLTDWLRTTATIQKRQTGGETSADRLRKDAEARMAARELADRRRGVTIVG